MEQARSPSDFEQRQCAVSLPVSLTAHSHVTKISMGVDCVMPTELKKVVKLAQTPEVSCSAFPV